MEARRPYDIDSLTDIAFRVFADRGYDGASMDDVAREAGVTKAALYHHVAGKEALLERGLDRALSALAAILREPDSQLGTPLERVRHIVRRVSAITFALLPELTVLFRVQGTSETAVTALRRRREFDRYVTGLIAEAQTEGEVRADIDAGLAARLLFGMTNSVVEWYRADGGLTPEAISSALEALAFEGLLRRSE